MAELKVSKKHHKHINNPFPSNPKTLPFIHGSLSFVPNKLSQDRTFQIGEDFQLAWSPRNGGFLSISHRSQSDRSIWSTIPGEAFISAAAVQTRAEESRGSFVINDSDVHFICRHQSVEDIRVLLGTRIDRKAKDHYPISGTPDSNDEESSELFQGCLFPALVITGRLFSEKNNIQAKKNLFLWKKRISLGWARKPSLAARYWLLLEQKSTDQVGFHVKFGEYDKKCSPRNIYRSLKITRWKLKQTRSKWMTYISSRRGFVKVSTQDEQGEEEVATEFNKVFLTYASDEDERFYGFGEQFSRMEFKGKRVPILVQEQGIGRGDQPITFAANLISYRYSIHHLIGVGFFVVSNFLSCPNFSIGRSGGDWSTTYAPSPFYMTSKMRSLYLEGYNYSVFDLTKLDRVQIQVHYLI